MDDWAIRSRLRRFFARARHALRWRALRVPGLCALALPVRAGAAPRVPARAPAILIVYAAQDGEGLLPLCQSLVSQCRLLLWIVSSEAPCAEVSRQVHAIVHAPASYGEAPVLVKALRTRTRFAFALTLGTQTRMVLPTLARSGLPVVSLLRSRQVATLPKFVMQELLLWSHATALDAPADRAQLCAARPGLNPAVLHPLSPPSADPAYGQALRRLGGHALAVRRQEVADLETIMDAEVLALAFCDPAPEPRDTLADRVRRYLHGWRSGLIARKPMPGFHPGVYRAAQGRDAAGVDALAHWLRAGRPAGPWYLPAITPAAPDDAASLPSCALHIHAYYPELVEEMLVRLALNRLRPDLFVSAPSDAACAQLRALLARYPGRVMAVQRVPNAGRDIGPFLTAFGPRLCADYAIIGHLHTKQSPHVGDRDAVARWRQYLLDNLLGTETAGPMADRIVQAMQADASLAMVYPDHPRSIGWDANRAIAQTLAPRLGIAVLPDSFNFPAGNMFWLRAPVLQAFVDLGLGWADYPAEPLGTDGTLLHAIERLFGIVPAAAGLRSAVVWDGGLGL